MSWQLSLPFFGFIAGVLLWSRVVHMSIAIYSAVRKVDLVALLKEPTESQLSVFLLVALLSCLGWLLAFGGLAVYLGVRAAPSTAWALFFAGIALGPAPACFFTVRNVRRMRQRSTAPVQP